MVWGIRGEEGKGEQRGRKRELRGAGKGRRRGRRRGGKGRELHRLLSSMKLLCIAHQPRKLTKKERKTPLVSHGHTILHNNKQGQAHNKTT